MAAAAVSSATVDLKSQATFPIRLGHSISHPAEAPQYTSVRYNYKPQLEPSASIKAVIREGTGEGKSRLSIDVEDGEYQYSGRYAREEDCFVLVIRGQGKESEMTLERLDSTHGFDVTRTPLESDAAKLAARYPHLQEEADEDDLFGDEDEDTPPDDSNPFDYRHFLKVELEKPESTNANLDAARSSVVTPLVQHRAARSTPATKPLERAETKSVAIKKRKASVIEKVNPKRVKAGQELPSSAQASKPEMPKININRKASSRRPSLDDSGDLILENDMETPTVEKSSKQHISAMALALSGQLGTGPISLRSAANSPGNHVTSPGPSRPEDMEEEYVFEFDDDPEPEDQEQAGDHTDANGDKEEDEDADIEDLELPSPVGRVHRPSVTAQSTGGGGDDDDDLDKQLMFAMMEEDDGGNQESEESEEE